MITTEEIFPLVNEEGDVTGQATRSRCHNGSMLLHPVVHLHVFNAAGELYLQRRSSQKDIFPNLWDSAVGGHVNPAETPEAAVMREAREELGLTGFEPVFIQKHVVETAFERELTYSFRTTTKQIPQPDGVEVSDGRFWTLEEIRSKLHQGVFTPNFEIDFELLAPPPPVGGI
ncbi:NUDIX hydrolase [Viscerimonas tarda]